MAKREVSYELLSGDEKREKAVADVKEYIGKDRWEKLKLIYAMPDGGEQAVRFGLEVLLGVEGYPVEATIETLQMVEVR